MLCVRRRFLRQLSGSGMDCGERSTYQLTELAKQYRLGGRGDDFHLCLLGAKSKLAAAATALAWSFYIKIFGVAVLLLWMLYPHKVKSVMLMVGIGVGFAIILLLLTLTY